MSVRKDGSRKGPLSMLLSPSHKKSIFSHSISLFIQAQVASLKIEVSRLALCCLHFNDYFAFFLGHLFTRFLLFYANRVVCESSFADTECC